jgi:hypothetical protein
LRPVRKFHENRTYYLPLLLALSIITHFPFVLHGFGEIDATKIAVSVIDLSHHGPDAAFANFYFTDVIPLYILYLSWFMKLLRHNYSYLPVVMNYTNAVFGTLTVVPAFFLVKKLFRNPTVAFCSVLALIFAPSFYQSTIMGFPHLIAFFFLLVSLYFFLSGLDHDRKSTVSLMIFLSSVFLTLTFLFKSDYVLASASYIGFLFMRKTKDKGKITGTFLLIITSGLLFFLFRNMILGQTSGTTMSKEGLSKWYDYSLIIPSTIDYFIAQAKPVAYGAGIVTFSLGIISFAYFLLKRRLKILFFVVSWAALPIFFWLIMIGNNARHNMFTILPIIVMIVVFFYEKSPRYVVILTVAIIIGNFFITAPSSSILTPSGNLYRSTAMLNDRMVRFQSLAKEIAKIQEDKIVVLGYFHNPHVVFEIMRSALSYEAVKIGREDYRILVGNKEFVFFYFVVAGPGDLEEGVSAILNKYDLNDHIFASSTYDLRSLSGVGLKIKSTDIIKRSEL